MLECWAEGGVPGTPADEGYLGKRSPTESLRAIGKQCWQWSSVRQTEEALRSDTG